MRSGINVVRNTSDNVTSQGWVNFDNSESGAVALNDIDTGASTGWGVSWITQPASNFGSGGTASGGTGDLSWAIAGSLVGTVAAPLARCSQPVHSPRLTLRCPLDRPLQ